MKEKRILMGVLLILIVADGSDASLFGKIRKLVDSEEPKDKSDKVSSPSPSPLSSVNSDHTKPVKPANSPKEESAGSLTDERCKVSLLRCHDQGNLTACLQFSGEAPGEFLLLVQNDGESTLKVNGDILPKIPFKEMQLHKQQAEKINFTAFVGKSILIVLTAGNGSCTIRMGAPKSDGNFFQRLPSYVTTQVTPINGAYLLSLTILIIGGMWACCKWGRRGRRVDGIPYQELEMGQTDSISTNNVETAEGWDEGWDNDWDEEDGVKTLSRNHVGNGSVNGLNSRPSKRDGRGNDWDD